MNIFCLLEEEERREIRKKEEEERMEIRNKGRRGKKGCITRHLRFGYVLCVCFFQKREKESESAKSVARVWWCYGMGKLATPTSRANGHLHTFLGRDSAF